MLIVYSQQEINAHNYVNRLLEQVNKLNSDESKMPVVRIMVDALERIYDKPDIFANDEYLLFGNISSMFISSFAQYNGYVFLIDIFRFMDCRLFIVLFTVRAREMLAIYQ